MVRIRFPPAKSLLRTRISRSGCPNLGGSPSETPQRPGAHELQCVIQDGRKYVVELTKCVVQVASCKPIGSHPSTPSIRDGHIKGQ